jgi:hypothetical protein
VIVVVLMIAGVIVLLLSVYAWDRNTRLDYVGSKGSRLLQWSNLNQAFDVDELGFLPRAACLAEDSPATTTTSMTTSS